MPAGPAPRPPRPAGLGRLLREADLAFHQVLAARLSRYDVSVAQYQHLRQLWDNDGLTQIELSRSLGVKEASSTSVIAGLEAKGLVTRRRSEADRRKLHLHVTPKGAAIQDEVTACARNLSAEVLEGLSPAEAEAFRGLLLRVTERLRAAPVRP